MHFKNRKQNCIVFNEIEIFYTNNGKSWTKLYTKNKIKVILCINLIEFLIVVCSYSPDNPEVLEKTVWQDRSMPGMRDRRWRLINWRERQAEHRTDPAPLRDNVPVTDKQQWHRRRAAGSRPDIGESFLLFHLIKQLKFWVHNVI